MLRLDEIHKPDIVEVVSQHITLKKVGNDYKGLCPFHDDKDPSLVIYVDTQRFKCFGCDTHGDVLDFVMRLKGLSLKD
ncbi:Zinc finger, CHC2-type domain protein, partial [Candidatus Magnetobacterium bavaricum]